VSEALATVVVSSSMERIPADVMGWWKITDTRTWGADDLDILGPALIS
jgi:hypothetical protein